MKKQKIFFFIIIPIFQHISTMELTIHQIPLPAEITRIIFNKADFKTKNCLLRTGKAIQSLYINDEIALKNSDELGLTLKNFIKIAYHFKNNEIISFLLSQKCESQHKTSLINYFRYNITGGLALANYDKVFFNVLPKIIQEANQKRVKYYIPFFNTVNVLIQLTAHIDDLLNPSISNQIQKSVNKENITQLIQNDAIAQTITNNICSFFNKESTLENLIIIYNSIYNKQYVENKKNIDKAIEEQNIPVLALLRHARKDKKQTCDKLYITACENDIYNRDTYHQQSICAKAHIGINIPKLITRAIEQKKINKAQNLLKIYIKQGHTSDEYISLFAHILTASCTRLISMLIKGGITATPNFITKAKYYQLKLYVDEGYKVQGNNFWNEKTHQIILHEAVQSNNKTWVNYLLILNAPTNVKNHHDKTPILYSLSNNQIFNILIKFSPSTWEEQKIHMLFFNRYGNLKKFIRHSPEQKIVQLFEHNFFPTDLSTIVTWIEYAIKLDKYNLFMFLFNKISAQDLKFLNAELSKKIIEYKKKTQ